VYVVPISFPTFFIPQSFSLSFIVGDFQRIEKDNAEFVDIAQLKS